MPSLPDALTAPPPRPVRSAESAAPSPGAPGEDGASGTPFADLMDDAGAEDETAGQPDSTTRTGGAPAGADAALAALLPLLTAPPPATAPGTAQTGMVPEALPSGGLPATPPIAVPPAETNTVPQPPAQAAAQPGPPQPVAPLPLGPAAMPSDSASDGSAPDGTTANGTPAAPPTPPVVSGAKPDAAALFQAVDSPPPAKTDGPQAPSPQLQQAMAQAGNSAAANGGAGQNPGQGQGQGRGNPPAGLEALSAPAPAMDGTTAPLPSTLAPPSVHAAAHYTALSGESAAARPPAAQMANQLVRVVEAGGGEFHIDLKPEELGPVRVVAELSGARVALHVQAESPETLALLRRDIHQLERALSDAGFELDGGTLNFSLRGDGEPRGFAFSGQGDGPGERGDGAGRTLRHADPAAALPPERAVRPIDGLVDISV